MLIQILPPSFPLLHDCPSISKERASLSNKHLIQVYVTTTTLQIQCFFYYTTINDY
jgi:hypothetical protein